MTIILLILYFFHIKVILSVLSLFKCSFFLFTLSDCFGVFDSSTTNLPLLNRFVFYFRLGSLLRWSDRCLVNFRRPLLSRISPTFVFTINFQTYSSVLLGSNGGLLGNICELRVEVLGLLCLLMRDLPDFISPRPRSGTRSPPFQDIPLVPLDDPFRRVTENWKREPRVL